MPKLTKKGAAKKAWKAFADYIKLRDSIAGFCRCCSCGRVKPIKEMDAGHFISRRHKSILFDESNVHAQCVYCNRHLSGNWEGYFEFMLAEYGQIEIDRLLQARNEIKKFTIADYLEIEAKYKTLRGELL
jgi:hypothetical protein